MKWEKIKLEECIKVKSGVNLTQENMDLNGCYPVYGGNGITGYHNAFNVNKSTIIIGRVGYYCGSVHVTEDKAWITDNAFITSFSEDVFFPKFLFYALKQIDLRKYSNSSAQPVISGTGISKVEIICPPLHIQEQIADTLDKADALRKKDQELLQKYDELAQAIFYDMFGDPVRNEKGWRFLTLEQISLVKGQYGSGAAAIKYNPQKFRYVRITDITENGKLNNKPVSADENNSDYKLQDGDLLFARTGATVGKTYLYKDEDGPCIFAGYLIRFRINREVAIPDYIFHFCKTNFYKNWVSAKQNVVAQPNINAKQYGKELLIPIPPINLQERFLKLLTRMEKSSDLSFSGFKKTESLFSAFLQKKFS